ncbi:hypothetical protein [Streptomyces sp. BE303]|uniref:hypothetical protein n=1 Tax=Streptomyces sp. BE303 TaxID=3002528 RepID=UPI002E76B521|nr:hypothetical protein [Streptomyces sp. BE303]MED7948942.1 hypothetical protein [Streptomyces sp. BE303]
MSEIQAVATAVTVARPPYGTGRNVPARRADRAPVREIRPVRGEGEGADTGAGPTSGPGADEAVDADRRPRGRAAHCRIAMWYVD